MSLGRTSARLVLLLALLGAALAFASLRPGQAAASAPCAPASDLLSIWPSLDPLDPDYLLPPTEASCFEGFDGNQVREAGASHSTHFDWQQIVANAGDYNFMSFRDDLGDSTFSGGDKENDPGGWNLDTTGSTQNKVNVLAAATATDDVSNNTFVYAAFQRLGNTGDIFASFELNANAPPDADNNPATVEFPRRSEGDVLVTFDGNQGNIDVRMCKWHGDHLGETTNIAYGWYSLPGFGSPGSAKAAGSTGCTLVSDGISVPKPTARGEVNAASISNFIPSMGASVERTGDTAVGSNTITDLSSTAGFAVGWIVSGPGIPANTTVTSIGPGSTIGISNPATAAGNNVDLGFQEPTTGTTLNQETFGEVVVNLSQALQAGGASNACFAFGSIWLHTRASHSFTNNMEDLVAAQPLVGASSCAIEVDKKVATQKAGDPDPTVATFSGNTTNGSAVVSGISSTAGMAVGNGVSGPGIPANTTIQSVNSATQVTLSNNATATAAGVHLAYSSIVYHEGTNADPSYAATGDTLHYLLTVTNPGQEPIPNPTLTDTECTGEVVVSKQEGANDTGVSNLDPGDTWTYKCERDVVGGDTSPIENTATVTGAIDGAICPAPANRACVSDEDSVETTKLGRVKIVKQTNPDGSTTEFDFTSPAAGGGNGVTGFDTAQLSDGEEAGFFSVQPGSYTVSEDNETGWDLTSISCSDSTQGGGNGSTVNTSTRTATFNVQAGEDVTCTFNNREQSSIKFVKQTTPDGSAAIFSFTTAETFNDTTLSDGQDSGATSVAPGTYRVQEDDEDRLGPDVDQLHGRRGRWQRFRRRHRYGDASAHGEVRRAGRREHRLHVQQPREVLDQVREADGPGRVVEGLHVHVGADVQRPDAERRPGLRRDHRHPRHLPGAGERRRPAGT